MQGDFVKRWRMVVRALVELPMQPENRWQRAGDEPEVIEVGMEKTVMHMGLDEPAIDGIRAAAREKQRVAQIAEAAHVRAG